jgi:ABC transport system ATP-binding/permease protein
MQSPLIGHYLFILHGREELTLEGNLILPGRFYAFREGSIIRGPRISPVYYTDISNGFIDREATVPFVFAGQELNFRFPNSDNGLHHFSFSEHSGQLIAVMGGSGVGKSTLLNILNGNLTVDSGNITINNFDLYLDKNQVHGFIGYVPQDDLLFEDLTVWENLFYNARLCFNELSVPEIEERVDRMLHELELHPFKDLKVGSPLKKTISGGQRKRLNIALELIREPYILFVDEPTSGLSSTDSEMVMLLLKKQARNGKLIIVNIHQPSSAIFKLFDQLWIMDKGGRPIYTGNPLDAIIYFKNEINHINADVCECAVCGNVNPEQVLEIIETKKIDGSGNFTSERRFTPEYWHQVYLDRNSLPAMDKEKKTLPETGFKKPGLLKQFFIFFARNLRTKTTDRQYMLINLLEAPLLAALVAYFTRFAEGNEYLFFENKSLISYLFMSIVVVLFMGMSVSAEEIIRDRKILQRESFLNLSRFSYLNSKIIFLVGLSAYQTLSFVLTANLILGIEGMYISYWMVLFSVAVFSNMLGLNISAAFDSVVTIYILIPLLLIPQILLCGVIVKFDDLQDKTAPSDHVTLAGEIMVSRWAFEALAVKQFRDNDYMAQFFELDKQIAQARFRSEILTTELTGKIDLVAGYWNTGQATDEIESRLLLIKNEIRKLDTEHPLGAFAEVDKLNAREFDGDLADRAMDHLKSVQNHFSEITRVVQKAKDRIIINIERQEGKQYLYLQKLKYHNKSLEALVLNSDTREFFRETPVNIIQKIAPIYKDPDSRFGRAHFLASGKQIGGKSIETYYFNLLVIWGMCSVLYVMLYFDLIRKAMAFKTFRINNKRKLTRS